MADWIDVCAARALAPGEHVLAEVDEISVVVFNVEGDFFAVEDMCSHDDALLSEGMLEDCEVICPRHGARFCLRTGEALSPPAYEAVETYAVRIENDVLQVASTDCD
jgi:3-phenylpropionate/trans-cinnamate dioxygenase ferredoxin subunit